MTYSTFLFEDVEVKEWVVGRILRTKIDDKWFKFYAHTDGKDGVVIYLGHGCLSLKIKKALKAWAKERGIKTVKWGESEELDRSIKISD